MKVYLAQVSTRPYLMRIYLAGEDGKWKFVNESWGGGYETLFSRGTPDKERQTCNRGGYILESYYYARNKASVDRLLPLCKDMLLDSGVFSFLTGSKTENDWDRYTELYAQYVNERNITHYVEMDIDALVPLSKVEALREKLITLTNKEPIVVWHASRGFSYYKEMVKRYRYVAIATTLKGKEGAVWRQKPELIKHFINLAHDAGAKIHGLGFTSLEMLRYLNFDSVDSTAWLYGNRAGYLYKFDTNEKGFMRKINVPTGHRLKSTDAARHNFNEWIKFQNYAEEYL